MYLLFELKRQASHRHGEHAVPSQPTVFFLPHCPTEYGEHTAIVRLDILVKQAESLTNQVFPRWPG
jgi:hypothetical protein